MLCKLPVSGRPTNVDYNRARAYSAGSRRVGVVWTIFLICHFSFLFLSPSLWETARYRLKHCLKGPLSPKQSTNQPANKYLNTGIFFYKIAIFPIFLDDPNLVLACMIYFNEAQRVGVAMVLGNLPVPGRPIYFD